MKINKNSLQARINNLSKEMNVHANVLLVSFFFDAFISRLAKSTYANKFVFKGGFYLATLLGVKNRYTADIDFLLKRETMDENRLRKIFTDIIARCGTTRQPQKKPAHSTPQIWIYKISFVKNSTDRKDPSHPLYNLDTVPQQRLLHSCNPNSYTYNRHTKQPKDVSLYYSPNDSHNRKQIFLHQ